MSEREAIEIRVDGAVVRVPRGTSVAAALWNDAPGATRRSLAGEPRAALCGMGICHECRCEIDGVAGRRACLIECVPGMEVRTDRA